MHFFHEILHNFFLYIKMSKEASAKYQKQNQKRFCEKNQRLTEKEKNRKWKCGRWQCKNLSENEKQKLSEYRKRSYEIQKNTNLL